MLGETSGRVSEADRADQDRGAEVDQLALTDWK